MSVYLNINQSDLRTKASQAVSAALAAGAQQAHVTVGETGGCRASARCGAYETLVGDNAVYLHLKVYADGKQASASASALNDQAIGQVAQRVVQLLPFGGTDPLHRLPDRDAMAWDTPTPDIYRPATLTPPELVDRACTIEAGARDVGPEIGIESATYSSHDMQVAIATSDGFIRSYSHSFHRGTCNATARDDIGMQSGSWWSGSRALDHVQDGLAIGAAAAAHAVAKLNPRPIVGGAIPILFAPDVAQELVGHLIGALAGDAQYRRATFLPGAIGTPILSHHIDIVEAPFLALGSASMPFDGEGIAASERPIVEAGRLEGYFLSTYSGRKLGLPSTGNASGPTNLIVRSRNTLPGDDTAAMLRKLGTGLFVTGTTGQGVNITSGTYSRAVTGFWVQHGLIAWPVEGVTIAGNLSTMFIDIVALGADSLKRGPTDVGSILIDTMHVAGK